MDMAARTGAWAPSGAPLPYLRRVAYLASHGTEYIDTGVLINSNTGFEIKVKEFKSTTSGALGALLKCAARPAGWTRFQFGRRDNVVGSNQLFYGIWSGDAFGGAGYEPILIDYSIPHTFKYKPLESKLFYADDRTGTVGIYTPDEAGPFYLFATYSYPDGKVPIQFSAAQIEYAKFYDGENLIRDLYPVIDLAGRPAMYDEVGGQLFYNQGTGEFTWGEL